jgi:hypothetical protein
MPWPRRAPLSLVASAVHSQHVVVVFQRGVFVGSCELEQPKRSRFWAEGFGLLDSFRTTNGRAGHITASRYYGNAHPHAASRQTEIGHVRYMQTRDGRDYVAGMQYRCARHRSRQAIWRFLRRSNVHVRLPITCGESNRKPLHCVFVTVCQHLDSRTTHYAAECR